MPTFFFIWLDFSVAFLNCWYVSLFVSVCLEKYLLGSYEVSYTDGTVATLPVRYGSHIGCATQMKTLGNSEFLQLLYGVLPMMQDGRYIYRTAYEDPHPEKTVASVRYLPAAGREEIAVELLGFSRIPSTDIHAHVAPCTDTSFSDDVMGLQE